MKIVYFSILHFQITDEASGNGTSLVVCNGPSSSGATNSGITSPELETNSLEEFQQSLSKFTRYSTVRPLATLSYASDIYNTSSIVSR